MVMLPLPMTPWQRHKERWGSWCGSELCKKANRIVLARGSLPCDVLFCGEAPGKSEDLSGVPFCGPAGQLLDQMIAQTKRNVGEFTCAFTNLVSCLPLDDSGAKVHEPEDEQVECCKDRLVDLIDTVAHPKLLVCVGRAAERWFDSKYLHSIKPISKPKMGTVDHPAGILRRTVVDQGYLIQRFVVTLTNLIEEMQEG